MDTQNGIVMVSHSEKVEFLMDFFENVQDNLIIIGPCASGKTTAINEAFDKLVAEDTEIAINFILWHQSENMKLYRNNHEDDGYKFVCVRRMNDEFVQALCKEYPETFVVYFEPDFNYELSEVIDANYSKNLTRFA